VQLVSKNSNLHVILIHQRYRQTDGRTDDVRSQDRALHYTKTRVAAGLRQDPLGELKRSPHPLAAWDRYTEERWGGRKKYLARGSEVTKHHGAGYEKLLSW